MDVRALSFTGSGRTGRLIQAAAAKSNLKAVFLELGGKSPAVIFEDADLDLAVEGVMMSKSDAPAKHACGSSDFNTIFHKMCARGS